MKKICTGLLEIAYLETGEPDQPAVVLLHGWPDDASTYDEIASQLTTAGFRTVAPFYRGFGQTRFLSEESPRTGNTGRLAMDVMDLLNTLAIESFSLVGHDWGSNVAEAVAVGWPKKVKKLVQISTPSRLGGLPTPPFELARLEWYHWYQATKRGAEAVAKDPIGFAKIMWDTWSPKGWYGQKIFDAVSQSWLHPDFVAVTLHSYRSRWGEAEVDPQTAALEEKIKMTKSLSLPAIFIGGEEDGVNRPWVSEKVCEKFTGPFERIIMPGIGHFPTREAPDEIAEILIKFLKYE